MQSFGRRASGRSRSPTSRATSTRSTTCARTSSARSPRATWTARSSSARATAVSSTSPPARRSRGRRPTRSACSRSESQDGELQVLVDARSDHLRHRRRRPRRRHGRRRPCARKGFDGDIVLIGAEPMPPYERPPLSKEYLRGESDHHFVRPAEWYEEQRRSTRGSACGPSASIVAERVVELEGGERVAFDQAVIATGARNRRLTIPGRRPARRLDLRFAPDADAISEAAAAGSKAVIVGMGFIGAEVAASLRQIGLDVTVVEFFGAPLERVLGPTARGRDRGAAPGPRRRDALPRRRPSASRATGGSRRSSRRRDAGSRATSPSSASASSR